MAHMPQALSIGVSLVLFSCFWQGRIVADPGRRPKAGDAGAHAPLHPPVLLLADSLGIVSPQNDPNVNVRLATWLTPDILWRHIEKKGQGFHRI
ncbi:unnamed protein product, partial [marine sediment metagenome]